MASGTADIQWPTPAQPRRALHTRPFAHTMEQALTQGCADYQPQAQSLPSFLHKIHSPAMLLEPIWDLNIAVMLMPLLEMQWRDRQLLRK